jgi:hypothetical protein
MDKVQKNSFTQYNAPSSETFKRKKITAFGKRVYQTTYKPVISFMLSGIIFNRESSVLMIM